MDARRDVFQAIADPTRREIINLIAYKSLNLNTLADNFNISRPAISQQIKILYECGLIEVRKQGRERYIEARLQPLADVSDWLENFRKHWAHKFDKLDNLLDELKGSKKKPSTKRKPKS
jgi:DNA-binding transcriptional ArsR family regulator